MRRVFRTVARLIVLILISGTACLVAWVQLVGFGPGITARVAQALSIGDATVEIGRLRFNPFAGIIAEQCRISITQVDKPAASAEISRLIISPNLSALLTGDIVIDHLLLENGEILYQFANDGEQPDTITAEISEIEIAQTQSELRILSAIGSLEGFGLHLTATLQNPAALQLPSTNETTPDAEATTRNIRRLLNAIQQITFHHSRPRLTVNLRGDLSDPHSLEATVFKIQCGPVSYREMKFDGIEIDATYRERRFALQKLLATGPDTSLRLVGDWSTKSRSGEFDVSGRLLPSSVLASIGKPEISDEVQFLGSAKVAGTIQIDLATETPDVRAIGRLEAGAFEMRKIGANKFASDFSWHNGKLFISDARLDLQSGSITADVISAPGDFRLRVHSNAIPTELLPIMGKYERAVIEVMEFRDAPEISLTVTGDRPHMDALSGTGHATLGRTAMRGAWIESATTNILFEDRAVIYRDILLKMGGREATGSFTYDFGRREVRLGNVKSHVMPADILLWVDPRIAKTVAVYKFRTPPYVEADGLVHMKTPDKNSLSVTIDAPGGLDYELIGKNLPFGKTRGTVKLIGQKVFADVPQAALYGGNVALKAEVSTNPKNPEFGADVTIDRVDFASITKRYFQYEKSAGVMSGRYKFSAQLQDAGTMRGEGSIRVEDGHVLSIPVFGPLSEVISAIIPGAGHESARLATADFSIANNTISSPNLEIEGAGFSLFGNGDVKYPSGAMDMTVRINARGITGVVLFPVSKLLEYVSTGTVSDPQWRPKVVPREFYQILGLGGETAFEQDSDAKDEQKPPAVLQRPRSGGLKSR